MGLSGFPFPSALAPAYQHVDGAAPQPQKGSLCTPSIVSPGPYTDLLSAAATPSDVSDTYLLPSVVSPAVAPRSSVLPLAVELPQHRDARLPVSPASGFCDEREPSAFADAIPPDASLPTPPQDRALKLRLPSFHGLGIANPHPDEIDRSGEKLVNRAIAVVSSLPSDLPGPPSFCTSSFGHAPPSTADSFSIGSGSDHHRLPLITSPPQDIAILTPPEEMPIFDWVPSDSADAGIDQAGAAADPSLAEAAMDATATPTLAQGGPAQGESEGEHVGIWLDGAIDHITSSIDSSHLPGHSMRVLSHALPSPSILGHSFPHIIEHLRGRLPSSGLMFINLLHAVPGRFNLSDLPTSPPSTPGQPLGSSNGTGEDYFTAKVFEAAVTAIDYSSAASVATPASTGALNNSHSSQQFSLAAPSSLNLTIVERFIPPSSRNEFANLFSLTKPSLLVDRLIELTPGSGCLVFIYPTRPGAETFCTKYLSPILDPVLRAMVVVNNFSADLSGAIGRMAAVPHMHDFETLSRSVVELCTNLQRESTSNPHVRQRLHGHPGNFSVVYSARQYVHLARSTWTNWLIKQEKTRVRRAVELHFRCANRYMADSDTTPTNLIEDIFNGIAAKPYPAGQEPSGNDSKIEMGVFVIKRG